MRINRFIKQFNWRFLLVRILVNALALAITAAVTPKIYFVDKTVLSWMLMALMLGVLNALLKPVLQFLTLPFIFVTYGLVVVLVNSLLLWLLSLIFPNRFAVENLLWALAGGLVLGLVSSFLESLLGLTMPIVPEEETALRRQLEEEARHVDWLAAASHGAAQEEQALAIEPPTKEAEATGSDMAETAAAESAAVEDIVAEAPMAENAAVEDAVAAIAVIEPAAAEPSIPGVDEKPSPPEAVEAEPFDSGVSVDSEPAPEPCEEETEEDRS